tara:strand:- start:34 stop:468 length:435 start_codon:yes stop_codon:yes gene_type:complete
MDNKKPEPTNKTLYNKVKQEAKNKFERYPSLYASAWIVREYKKRGGKYSGPKAPKKEQGTSKWFKEEWVQVEPYLKNGEKIQCGASNKDGKACRPLKKLDKTPITLGELEKIHSKELLLRITRQKQRDMKGRINWKKGTFTPSK